MFRWTGLAKSQQIPEPQRVQRHHELFPRATFHRLKESLGIKSQLGRDGLAHEYDSCLLTQVRKTSYFRRQRPSETISS
jgi:hypothetical protein